MSRLVGLVKPLAGYMFLAIIMGLIGHLCASFITVFGAVAVTKALGSDIALSFGIITVCLIVFAVVRGLLRYAEQSCNHFIAFKLLALIRDKVFFALRRLCPAKLEGRDKGDLISIITSDIELLEVFYAHTISPIAIAVLFTVVICGFLCFFSPVFAIIALFAHTTVGVIIPLLISKMSGDDGQKFRDKSGNISSFILDSLRGLNEIIQYGIGKSRLNRMKDLTIDVSKDEERMKKVTGRNIALTNSVILIFDLTMLFSAVYLYTKGNVDFKGVLISVVTLISSFGPAVALANLGSTLQNTFAAGNRVLDILDEKPVTEEITGKSNVIFSGAKAENISFSYGGEQILSDLSLEIPKDKIIGIIGRSGSGKSTLLKLFMRFWTVQNGAVKISDKNIDYINTKNLRDIESFVTQETHLFKDSIKNNIKIAKLTASDEEIIIACKKASLHNFIESLPNGYDTDVGELGDTLSGGEKQRIGLARAFLHDAPFMLLDEPTSNLDSLNEAVILKSLKEESENKTTVLVSHRESTMRIADKVYSVEHGRMS
ncbi:MAG: ABC transporter ATP-binding protein [Clostridia bacterium]|nr:ABC transporter ATP-binding protein [Clostridia bacterium]